MREFDELIQHGDALRSLARALFKNRADADDAVQDAWLAALADDRTQPRENVAWFRGVLKNLSLSKHRRSSMQTAKDRELTSPPRSLSAADVALQSETAVLVARAVRSLPEPYRDIVVLTYWGPMRPREIARELDIPVKTVRNRLHRGHLALRDRLRQHRSDSTRALALLGAVSASKSSTPFLSTTLAAVTAMKFKIATLAVVVTLLGLYCWKTMEGDEDQLTPSPGPSAEVEEESQRPRRVAVPETKIEEAPEETGSVDEETPKATSPHLTLRQREELARMASRKVGTLKLKVLDALTREPLDSVLLRIINDQRFAETTSPSAAEITLSQGRYSMLVSSAGYDPVETSPFEIIEGECSDLGYVELRPGSGVVKGNVRVPEVLAKEGLTVELHGSGRGPCSQYDAAALSARSESEESPYCPDCGYGAAKSRREVDAQNQFEFSNLGAGLYYVAVRDAKGVVLAGRRLEISAGEEIWVDLDLEFIDLDVVLETSNETPFEGHWIEESDAFFENVRFFFWIDSVCSAKAQYLTSARGASFMPTPEERPVDANDDKSKKEETSDKPPQRNPAVGIDRRRAPQQTLWPSVLHPQPRLDSKPLVVQKTGPGRFTIRNVPAASTSILVFCGPWMCERKKLDLMRGDGKPTEIFLSRCNFSSKMFRRDQIKSGGQGFTCNSCHQLPADILK